MRVEVRSQTTRSVALSQTKGLRGRRFFAAFRMTRWLDMAEVATAGGGRRTEDEGGRMCE